MQAPRTAVQRNRSRLVSAAREAFNEKGPGPSLEEIARRAGVGPVRSTATSPARTIWSLRFSTIGSPRGAKAQTPPRAVPTR
nr:TetR family transcriptional regulator [Mycobacterium terramassiliense]